MSLPKEIPNPTNLPVVDAVDPFQFDLVAHDVEIGVPFDPYHCGFANACRREIPQAISVCVFKSTTYITYHTQIVRYATTMAMTKEAISFDRSGIMETGRYQLRPVPPSKRFGVIRSGKQTQQKYEIGPHKPHFVHATVLARPNVK